MRTIRDDRRASVGYCMGETSWNIRGSTDMEMGGVNFNNFCINHSQLAMREILFAQN